MTQQTNSPLSGQGERAGIARDLQHLKKHGGMSLAELRDFVRQLHGRKPSEVMGIVSSSALIRAMLESTIFLGILIAVMTIVPFMMAGEKEKPASPTSTAASSEATKSPVSATADPTATTTSTDGSISAEDAQKAVDVMGLGETKAADPNKNPLDNLDNLLDDVK